MSVLKKRELDTAGADIENETPFFAEWFKLVFIVNHSFEVKESCLAVTEKFYFESGLDFYLVGETFFASRIALVAQTSQLSV